MKRIEPPEDRSNNTTRRRIIPRPKKVRKEAVRPSEPGIPEEEDDVLFEDIVTKKATRPKQERRKLDFSESEKVDEHSGTDVFSAVDKKRIKKDLRQKAEKKKGAGHIPIFKERDRKPNFAVCLLVNILRILLAGIFVVVAIGFGAVNGLADAYLESTPDLDVTKISEQAETSYIYDQNGTLLATYTGSENRDWASIEEIPVDLQHAVIAIEDIRFESHNGVDIKRLFGAFIANMSSNSVEGGSTITQQLIKNNILTSERSYKRKLQEAYLALQLEKEYSKDEILEYYLNNIPLGGTLYGVKAAAKDYFGKELDELTLKQMTCLAAEIQSPHALNPRRAAYVKEDIGALQDRMNRVLQRMYAAGFITEEQYNENFVPKSEWEQDSYLYTFRSELGIQRESPANEMYAMPHFTEYVVYDVCTHLLRKYDLEDNAENRAKMEQEIRSSGYRIYATVDARIQDIVQTTLAEWDDYPPLENGETEIVNSDGSTTIQPQASATIIDYEKGWIVGMIGSREAPSTKKTLNRAYQAGMPVGSSIKPIAVYTPAFDMGCGLVTPIPNIPVAIPGWQTDKGYPVTSQGTYGPMSIRQGIVESRNIVAARTLIDKVGLENSARYLTNQGVDPKKLNVDGVGLALGSSGLTTLDMSTCYSSIANGGYFLEPISFTKVLDSNGEVVLDVEESRKKFQAYKESSAWMTVDALIDAVDHGTGKRANIDGIETAGKTGTVVDARGTFFAGMTGYYVATLWVGADDYSELDASAASRVTAPLWKAFMTKIHEGLEDKPIHRKTAEEVGLEKITLCAYSGLLPGSGCSSTVSDYIYKGDKPTQHCDWCTSAKVCTVSHMLAGEFCPEELTTTVAKRVFPEDSPYAQWSDKDKTTEKEEGAEEGEEGAKEGEENIIEYDLSQTCTVHSAERNASVTYATEAISFAQASISTYSSYLSADQVNQINAKVAELQALLSNTDAATMAGSGDITAKSDELISLVNGIVAEATKPQPEPEPQPEPKPEPEPEPEPEPQPEP